VESAWKAIRDEFRRSFYLSKVYHVQKIRDRKQEKDIVNYSFGKRTIKNLNQLPAAPLGTFPCKLKIFRTRVRKEIIRVKGNRLRHTEASMLPRCEIDGLK
jgi:hypothetical protein